MREVTAAGASPAEFQRKDRSRPPRKEMSAIAGDSAYLLSGYCGRDRCERADSKFERMLLCAREPLEKGKGPGKFLD
jgi:hypothetical protein